MIATRVDIAENSALYTLSLPSKLNSLTPVENFVDTLKDEYEISDNLFAEILTCLSEAVNNAIVHGNHEDPSKKVGISLEVQDNKRLIFIVSDQGPGFDYTNIPDPTAPENLEKLTGRGIYIIRTLADACIFNQKGNEIEIHFNI
jgi:serine/threonine-protein kinase RsbW